MLTDCHSTRIGTQNTMNIEVTVTNDDQRSVTTKLTIIPAMGATPMAFCGGGIEATAEKTTK